MMEEDEEDEEDEDEDDADADCVGVRVLVDTARSSLHTDHTPTRHQSTTREKRG